MFQYKLKIKTVDDQTVVIDGYQANGRLTKRAAEQIARKNSLILDLYLLLFTMNLVKKSIHDKRNYGT